MLFDAKVASICDSPKAPRGSSSPEAPRGSDGDSMFHHQSGQSPKLRHSVSLERHPHGFRRGLLESDSPKAPCGSSSPEAPRGSDGDSMFHHQSGQSPKLRHSVSLERHPRGSRRGLLESDFPEAPRGSDGDSTSHHHPPNRPNCVIPFRSSVIPTASAGGFWSRAQRHRTGVGQASACDEK